MLKRDELEIATSCFNKARDNELIFVLLGRDVAAPAAIAEWIKTRILLKKNVVGDRQLSEAAEWITRAENARCNWHDVGYRNPVLQDAENFVACEFKNDQDLWLPGRVVGYRTSKLQSNAYVTVALAAGDLRTTDDYARIRVKA